MSDVKTRASGSISNWNSGSNSADDATFQRYKYGDKPAINGDDDDEVEHRGGGEERREVCRGFPAESEKGTPLGPTKWTVEERAGDATLTGVKRSPFSADYFARGGEGVSEVRFWLLAFTPILHLSTPRRMPPVHSLTHFPHAHFSRPLTLLSPVHMHIHRKNSQGNNIIVVVPGEPKNQEIQQVHRSMIGFSCGIMDGLLKKRRRRRKVMSRK